MEPFCISHHGVSRANIVPGERVLVMGAGAIGILAADALLGEITPAMATAVGRSEAVKLLLPVNQCRNIVVGTQQMTLAQLVAEAVAQLRRMCEGRA